MSDDQSLLTSGLNYLSIFILHSFPHQMQWPHWILQALLKYIILFMPPSIMNSGLDAKNVFMFWIWNVIDKKLWSSFLHYNEKLQYYQVNNQKILAISLFFCCFPFTFLMVEIWLNLQIKVKCKCSQSTPAPPPPLLPLQHHGALFSCYNTHYYLFHGLVCIRVTYKLFLLLSAPLWISF